jgi:hypothetical protein
MEQQYSISFNGIDHCIIQTDDRFEAFFYKNSIGVYPSFMDAANAVLQIARLEAWNPPMEQRIFSH